MKICLMFFIAMLIILSICLYSIDKRITHVENRLEEVEGIQSKLEMGQFYLESFTNDFKWYKNRFDTIYRYNSRILKDSAIDSSTSEILDISDPEGSIKAF